MKKTCYMVKSKLNIYLKLPLLLNKDEPFSLNLSKFQTITITSLQHIKNISYNQKQQSNTTILIEYVIICKIPVRIGHLFCLLVIGTEIRSHWSIFQQGPNDDILHNKTPPYSYQTCLSLILSITSKSLVIFCWFPISCFLLLIVFLLCIGIISRRPIYLSLFIVTLKKYVFLQNLNHKWRFDIEWWS